MTSWEKEAENFLVNETEFHLGFLPSEARNPLTMHLDEDFQRSTAEGVKTLLACDLALLSHFRNALERPEYASLIEAMRHARKIVFSGCGATGRLAILLESAWNETHPEKARVLSIMTGGDFALIRSVENFEDYQEVGKKQVEELGLNSEDLLIGITATGETASIIGSAREAAARGARVFMLICVPAEIPCSRLERCRELYTLPNVTILDIPIGGMAITGSTRMQSSTIELLVAASALETATGCSGVDYGEAYEQLLHSLSTPKSISSIASCIDFEHEAYSKHRLIDYQPNDLLIDILSDTTERSPTFMIPPYKSLDEVDAPEPWAMVRNPTKSTEAIWQELLRRPPRCIAWTRQDYERANLAVLLQKGIPRIDTQALMRIPLGGELPIRNAIAVPICNQPEGALLIQDQSIGSKVVPTPLRLFEHLRMKLVMNIISTGTMVKFGRVRSNYMIHLAISNKKLVDRATRIISELCHVTYEQACRELFRTQSMQTCKNTSPVAETIRRLS
jgi:N-acetylmuramic acid 6-phosphate etherase